jgi:2-oxoglutarate dehydrogenase E1 component
MMADCMNRESELPVPPPSFSNLDFVEELYFRYLRDPSSVDEGWRRYFAAMPAVPEAAAGPGLPPPRRAAAQAERAAPAAAEGEAFRARVDRLVQAYRDYGHLRANLDPLGLERGPLDGFDLQEFGLSRDDLDRPVTIDDPGQTGPVPLRELEQRLQETYTRTIGVQLGHIHDRELRRWLERRMERTRNRLTLAPEVKKRLLEKLVEADAFEKFLGTRFLGSKRFSLEGLDGLVPLLELLIDRAVGHGVRNLVIGMAHRGRLNVLANVIGKPLREIFAEFRDQAIVNAGGGDVKYHLGYSGVRDSPDGGIRLSLAFNPSHLEWIDSVVQGRVRAKQDRYADAERRRSLPVLVHGDAAFAGQGIVAECLNMSEIEGYTVGGTIHVVANNQVGFTTSPREARSTTYATDIALMLDIPVLHVNGEDLEAVAQAVLLAVDFRQRFHKDVVIDLWGYRRHGHNEGDEPSFTHPVMYRLIAQKPPLRKSYADALVREGALSPEEVEGLARAYQSRLEEAYQASSAIAITPAAVEMAGAWKLYRGGAIGTGPEAETAVAPEVVQHVARHLTEVPPGFRAHPKVVRILEMRAEMAQGKRPLDWGMAEALALGTLAWQGVRVRLAGQDSQRGTFSHRHAVIFDVHNNAPYMPLAHLREGQGKVEIVDSLLSEAAALGFEYGYSLERPDALVAWEAQFGDFVNGAQVIVDQFLCSSEAKWNRLSGLVLLLPHGLEGQGPEHSSARLERFLALSVDDNWQVMNLTTPAQIFHALRRQVLSPWRKPLVIMSPKSLLRHPRAVSPVEEITGGRFQAVLPDEGGADPAEITRVVLCSGKIYYDLVAAREAQQARHAAVVRLEQLYPLRNDELMGALSRYREGVEVVWAQEEPFNMGARVYAETRLRPLVTPWAEWSLVTRPPSPSPASGSATRHRLEQEALVIQALGQPRRARAELKAAQEG